MEQLFVYGIFLSQYNRDAYGMTNPRYFTVLDYATYGRGIVQAHYEPGKGLSLTGLLVDVDPSQWEALDRLETGYKRIKVKTYNGVEAWMYVAPKNNS